MNRLIPILVVVAALGSMVSGCVSTGKYTQMEAAKNQEIAALQKQNESLIGIPLAKLVKHKYPFFPIHNMDRYTLVSSK